MKKTNINNKNIDNETINNLKKILNLIEIYEKNIKIIYNSNNNLLNRYQNMVNEIIIEHHKTCIKRNF
jgi:hypothetical protein